MAATTDKPTLQQIRWTQQGLTSQALAQAAGVPLRIEYLMEIGAWVSRQEAEKVLVALSQIAGHKYTLENVEGIRLRENILPR